MRDNPEPEPTEPTPAVRPVRAKRRFVDISDAEEARIQAGIAADPDNPEITDAEVAQLRPAAEVLPPELFAKLVNRGGRPKAEVTKVPVKLRLDPDVVEALRRTGAGWQTRVNDLLKTAIGAGTLAADATVTPKRVVVGKGARVMVHAAPAKPGRPRKTDGKRPEKAPTPLGRQDLPRDPRTRS